MFLGLRTVIYRVPDVGRAKAWYTTAFGTAPYFDEPFYVGFDIAGYELGLQPAAPETTSGTNVITYWGVPTIDVGMAHMVRCGARVHSEAKDVGGGIKVASVVDPFGNVIGLIENPHFQAVG